MRKKLETIFKILPFVIIAILIVIILFSGNKMTVDSVLSLMPDNTIVACVILLGMYALKSLSVIFPIIVLQIAAGLFFPLWAALLINITGTALTYTIPYLIGRFSGADTAEKLIDKYPKIKVSVNIQKNSVWFPSFILRAVSCLPGDIVSMYLGSIKVSYIPYVTASVIGTLPGLIPATVAGMSIMDPKSTAFIVSVIVTILTSVASILIYYLGHKKNS